MLHTPSENLHLLKAKHALVDNRNIFWLKLYPKMDQCLHTFSLSIYDFQNFLYAVTETIRYQFYVYFCSIYLCLFLCFYEYGDQTKS